MSNETTKITIGFADWLDKPCLEIEANSIAEAVEKAVKNGVNLRGADLSHVNLSRADLRHADLSVADLRHADLSGADLCGASLSGADLSMTDLFGTNLSGADLCGAEHNGEVLWKTCPVLQFGCCGSVGRATFVMFYADKSEPQINCGCFRGTISEFEERIHRTHGGTFHEYEYMAMVDHIKAIRKYQLEVKNEH